MSVEDRELIYRLFDIVEALSNRLFPDEKVILFPLGKAPRESAIPTGANAVAWISTAGST